VDLFSNLEEPLKEKKVFSVTEITREIRFCLEQGFSGVWVEGEISNLRKPSSGHIYMTLKDESCQLRAVMFRFQNRNVKFDLEDGQQVIAFGNIGVYEVRGEYQLLVEHIEPKGIGALQLAFEQLKEKLFKEGLFDEEHKKPIPFFPETIGVITSPTGAVIRDILRVIDRRFPGVHIVIHPVRVQGEGAAEEIAAAVKEMNALQAADVLILARGGGSIEDLWAFNEEIVARAVFQSKIPVISAIGHEIDYTISDFVADLRAPTPSAAAEMVIPSRDELLKRIKVSDDIIRKRTVSLVSEQRWNLDSLMKRTVFVYPERLISQHQQRMDELNIRLKRGVLQSTNRTKEIIKGLKKNIIHLAPRTRIDKTRNTLHSLIKEIKNIALHRMEIKRKSLSGVMETLDMLSPLSVLNRGYSICRTHPGMKLVKDATSVSEGDRLNVRVSKGEIICDVNKVVEGT
jgi:exodeoxyribonuclease VII large subunit